MPQISACLGVTVDELFETGITTHLCRIEQMLENQTYICEQDYDYALARLGEGLLDAATRARCLTMLAELNLNRSQMYRDRAAQYARQALEHEPENKDNHSALCMAEGGTLWDWCASNHTARIDYYKAFVKKNPCYSRGYLWLLDELIADGRLEEATETLEQMGSQDKSFRYLLYKGWIAHRAGRWDEAEALWEEMVRREPDNWYVWSCRGDAWAKRADYSRALADYRRAAELESPPRMTDNYDSIAQLCLLMGDKAGAAEAYRRVVEILRSDWNMREGETVCGYLENIRQLS